MSQPKEVKGKAQEAVRIAAAASLGGIPCKTVQHEFYDASSTENVTFLYCRRCGEVRRVILPELPAELAARVKPHA